MDDKQTRSVRDDTLFFAEETSKQPAAPDRSQKRFKLLIVDDENEIHVMTKLVLNDYQYMNQGLEFISAYSGEEAKEILRSQDDIACCLLDVVMETKDAGLEVARYIREEVGNTKIRIVLRTGQPGKAPEKDIILNYDINDYKEKTELTTQKLFTTITTALRSYIHLVELEQKNQEIQAKNIRLNEEIARRIVAESNLTKYNRSLERMIESKTQRLKEALNALEKTEKQLFVSKHSAIVCDLSAASMKTLDSSNTRICENLKKMNLYRHQMTYLLEKYNTLETIIAITQGTRQELEQATRDNLQEIIAFKKEIEFESVLEKYPKIIEDSMRGIQEISRAISDVKMFVTINDEAWTPTDINEILGNLAGSSADKGKKIDVQLDLQDLPLLDLPRNSLEKAVQAVMTNALMAVNRHGIISVTSRYEDPRVALTISDIGTGIAPDDLPKVFTPYFSAWPEGGRKGLGLAFAKSVFLSCGGDIKIASTAGEGTTVIMSLPIHTLRPPDLTSE